MAGAFGNFEDEEDNVLAPKEPQVTSLDPDERKAARALRIKRRQEALKRAEQPPEEAVADEEPTVIEQATVHAAEDLQRLTLEGAAKVTNVKVTTDEREVTRRSIFNAKALCNLEKIEAEAALSQEEYEAISNSWEAVLAIKDPLDIDVAMTEQKAKCDELLKHKNALIEELRVDLKTMDTEYYEDLEKQDQDIKELSERVERQVGIMQRAYEKQLSLVETAISVEREATVGHNNKRWEALYKQRDKEELAHMDYKMEQLEDYKCQIDAIMWEHLEKYREAKIELETLIQELQKELEKLKATCIINTEKIGYNYQILKKREEENVFVRSQQKRKLNKMSDVANALRVKIRKASEDGAVEEIRADVEIRKLMQAMDDIEKKSDHFSQVNDYKFNQVWRMTAARCAGLAAAVRDAEVAVHAHILAEPPPPPPPAHPKSPLKLKASEEDNGGKTVASQNSAASPKKEGTVSTRTISAKDAKEAKDKLVRHILRLVADNTGFLIEDRLFTLIEKYQADSRNLCTLDAIFMALEIQSEEDIELLCATFLKYAFCPICVGLDTGDTDLGEASLCFAEDSQAGLMSARVSRADRTSIYPRSSIARSVSISTSRSAHISFKGHEMSPSDQQLMTEAEEILQKCGDPQVVEHSIRVATSDALTLKRGRGVTVTSQRSEVEPKPDNPYLCLLGHSLEIEPMQVLTALEEFITTFVPPEKEQLHEILDGLKPPNFTTPSRELRRADIEQYWGQWRDMFPVEKERFWDGMLAGLNNYLDILKERDRLHDDVSELRRRNLALRNLVRGTLPEIPPPLRKYQREPPATFTAPMMDGNPFAHERLPRIERPPRCPARDFPPCKSLQDP